MPSRSFNRRSFTGAVMLAASALLASCSAPGTGADDGSISLSVSPTSGTVQQGNSLQVTGTLTRSGGFTGNVAFGVSGTSLPAGLTGSAGNLVTNGAVTTATITIATAATVPAGTYQITVTGSGSGVTSAQATFSLTVTAIPPGSYNLSVNPGAVSIAQGATGTTTLSINRSQLSAPVTLAVEGLPSGVTASFNPASPVTADNTVLTLTVAGAAAPGVSTLTIRGSTASLPVAQTTTLQLTITVAGDYTLSAAPPSLSVLPGAGGNSTISINRTGGFSGSVALAVTGAPANMTASVNPTPNGTNAATLTIGTTTGVVPGTYPLTITGTFAGLTNHTTTVTVTVINTTVRVDFSGCSASQLPTWFAGINGSATTKITPVANVYTFQVTEPLGGYAYVLTGGVGVGSAATDVQYQTRTELTASTIVICTPTPATPRTITGTVTGFGSAPSAQVIVNLGNTWGFGDYSPATFGFRTITSGTPGFSLQNQASGASDLVAWRTTSDGPTADDRGLFQRGINPANNASVGTVDMAGANSFAAATATATITGLLGGGDQQLLYMDYFTGAECSPARLNRIILGASGTEALFGVPAARQMATDFHSLSVITLSPSLPRRVRYSNTWFHTLANKVVALPPNFMGSVSLVTGQPYKSLLASGTIPSGYLGGGARLWYSGTINGVGFLTVNITASAGWLGGSALSLSLPDFTGQGYLPGWGVGISESSTYQLNIYGDVNLGVRKCQEGFSVAVASLLGNL